MKTVTVCVGSSCHIKGARQIITRFDERLKEAGIQDKVELKGSFCMDRCGEGINWQIDDQPMTSRSIEAAIESFEELVIEPATGRTGS
jgi:NADH:ubiquinone oxidoreductase subunit E